MTARLVPSCWSFSRSALPSLRRASAVLIGLLCAQAVVAQTALSNLGQPLSGGSYTAGGSVNGFNFGQGVNFTTGSSPVQFTGATFVLFLGSPYTAASGFHVTLNSGFSTSGPTGPLATLNGASTPAVGLTPAPFSYTATTPITLAANTTYWLELDAFSTTTNTETLWSATTNIGGIDAGALPGWTYYDGTASGYTVYFTNSGGSSWNAAGFSGVNFPQYSVQYQAAIPEPATYAVLFGLSVLGFAANRRRR